MVLSPNPHPIPKNLPSIEICCMLKIVSLKLCILDLCLLKT